MAETNSLYRAAKEALTESRLEDAQRLCLALISARPDFAEAYYLFGVAAGNAGRIRPALEALEKAVQLAPRAEHLAQYARFQVLARHDQDARESADRAAALGPADALTLDTIGCVFSRLGAHEKAAPLFQAAVNRQPDHVQMRFNLASSLGFLGRFDEAERHYEMIVAAQPNFTKAHSALAALKKQTPESNHVSRLEALLSHTHEGIEELHLRYALAKEYEDLRAYDAAFRHLEIANRRRKAQLRYDISSDRAIFDRLLQRFAEADFYPGISTVTEAPIFITGLPRTGTTLVDRILSSHPEVESAGELQAMPVAVKRLSNTSSRFVLDPETIDAARNIQPTELAQMYLSGAASHRGTRPRFVDKLPLNFLQIGFIARALPNAKIVCLRRHPLDTVWSNYKHLFSTNFSYYNYSYDLLDTAAYYTLFDKLLTFWRQLFPGRILELHYESIVQDLERETRRLLTHCGLTWSADCLRFHENTSAVATPSSMQVRQPIYHSALGRWRAYERYLTPVQDYLRTQGIEIDEPPAGR